MHWDPDFDVDGVPTEPIVFHWERNPVPMSQSLSVARDLSCFLHGSRQLAFGTDAWNGLGNM